MNQPARRRSSLTGANPVMPAEPSPQPVPAAAAVAPEPLERLIPPASRRGRARTGTPKKEERKYPPKVSFYQDPDDTTRLRAAYRHTLANTSDRSLSDFIQRVVMTEVQRLENQHNGGKPFPSVGAGEIPQGRPVGE